jgi:predicted porin
MKTNTFAMLGLTLLVGAVQAQNVTVTGYINTSIERLENTAGQSTTALVNNGSRLIFRGQEDLGNGMQAGFILAHGFDPSSGASENPAVIWNRRSEVNLSGSWGAVRLGNMPSEAYFAVADAVSMHNLDNGNSADALYAYLGRNRNKIAYRSPIIGGLTLHTSIALDESATSKDHSHDVAAVYNLDKWQFGAGYEKTGEAKQLAFRTSYSIGSWTFGGYVQRDQNAYQTNAGQRNSVRMAVMYTVGANEWHFNWGRAGHYSHVNDSHAQQYTVALNHHLSPKTKLFAQYTRLQDGQAAVYGGSRSAYGVGVMTRF